MLGVIEFSLLGGSLVVVIGLIVGGARNRSSDPTVQPGESPESHPDQHGNGL